MNPTDVLQTMAEISVALIGFAGVVVVFQRAGSDAWSAGDRARFLGMVSNSFGALSFSLLPLLFVQFAQPSRAWQASSAVLVIFLVLNPVVMDRITRRAMGVERLSIGVVAVLAAGSVAAFLAALSNAIGWPMESNFTIYLGCLFWLVFASAINFFRLVYVGVSR